MHREAKVVVVVAIVKIRQVFEVVGAEEADLGEACQREDVHDDQGGVLPSRDGHGRALCKRDAARPPSYTLCYAKSRATIHFPTICIIY